MTEDPFKEETIDIKAIIFKYLRHWYWFVIALAIALTAAYFYNKFAETVYKTNATVLIRDDRKGGFRPGQVMGELDLFNLRRNIYNEIAILRSYNLVDSTVRQMDIEVSYYNIGRIVGEIRTTEIYRNTPFIVDFDSDRAPRNLPFSVKIISEKEYEIEPKRKSKFFFSSRGFNNGAKQGRFGEEFRSNGYSFTLRLSDRYNPSSHNGREYLFVIHNLPSVTSQYRSKISVDPLNPDVSIVNVSFEATNAERAIDFLNRLTENYIYRGLDEKNQIAINTIRFIDEQIGLTTDSLYMTEKDLQEFRSKHQLMDISQQANQLYSSLSELDKVRATEMVKKQYYDYLLEYLNEDKDFSEMHSPSSMGIADQLLNKLVTDLAMLYAERSRAIMSSTEYNPYLITLDNEIRTTKRALSENILNIKKSNEILLDDINRRIEILEKRIRTLPQTERELIGIQRKFNLNEATYNYLMEKRAESGIALASNMPDNQIIDAARGASVVSPRKNRSYLIALVIGLVLPMGIMYLRDFLNTKIQDKKDVTSLVKYPIIGVIPHMRHAARNKSTVNLIPFKEYKTPVTEAFRALRANLSFMAPEKASKIVSITSAKSEEGKTFTAVNLALVLALTGKKTLVMSADLRRPRITRELNINKEPGLANYLIGKNSLEDIIQQTTEDENLYAITSGIIPPNPSELIGTDKMLVGLEELKQKFDFIIVDTPPIGIVPDAIPVLKVSDIIIYIVRQKFTEKSSLEFLIEFVEKIKIENIAIEINDVKLGKSGYGYSYSYSYGYGYDYKGYYAKDESVKNNLNIFKTLKKNIKGWNRKR